MQRLIRHLRLDRASAYRGIHVSAQRTPNTLPTCTPAPSFVRAFATDASGLIKKSETTTSSTCAGCGVLLQTSDEGRIGFVPSIKLVEGGGILCQRCFHMKHYGKLVPLSVPYERFSEFLEDLKDRDVLCVHVVDAMNFDSSVIPGLERLIGRKPLVLVVNKADLLPTDIRQHRIVKWVRRQAKRLGMQNIVAVHLVSAKKGLGMREAVRTIADLRKKRDVYVIGAANVGKSTFLNRLLSTWWNLPPPPAKGSSQGGIMLDELPEELQATFANVEEGEAFPSNIADLRHRIREIQLEKRKKEKEAQGLHTEEWVEKQFQARMKNKSLNWKATTSHDDDDDEAILLDGPERISVVPETEDSRVTATSSNFVAGVASAMEEETGPSPVPGTVGTSDIPPHLEPTTEAPLPGTTLGLISLPLNATGSQQVVDTPGVVVNKKRQQLLELLACAGRSTLLMAVPQSKKKPNTVMLNSGKSLFLGGLARVDYWHPDPTKTLLLTVFSGLPLHVCHTFRANELFARHAAPNDLRTLIANDPSAAASLAHHTGKRVVFPLLYPCVGSLSNLDVLRLHDLAFDFRAEAVNHLPHPDEVVDSLQCMGLQPFSDTERPHGRVKWLPEDLFTLINSRTLGKAAAGRVRTRRQERMRQSVADVSFAGFGWVGVTPVEIEGTREWDETILGGTLRIYSADGVDVTDRPALLPFEASGQSPKDWLKNPRSRG